MKKLILVAVATIALVGGGIPVFAHGGKGGPPRQHPAFGKNHPMFGKDHPAFGKHAPGRGPMAMMHGKGGDHGKPGMRGGHGKHGMKPGGPGGFGHGRMGKELGLTDEQKAKMKEFSKTFREKQKADHEGVRKEMREGMQKFLNAEQKAKLEKFMQQRQEKKGDGKKKDAPAQPQQKQNFGPKRG